MRHNQNKHSTANHGNSQHEKSSYPSARAPQSAPKRSVLSRIRERMQEKPATEDEVKQLGLNAKRETYKTMIQKAKSARPSRFQNAFGNGGSRRSTEHSQEESGLFGGTNSGSWLMGPNNGPSLDFITGGTSKKKGRGRREESGFGKGLEDLF